jgi:diguanylate cyclase (GGDEF)-like protein/PAS domain S-box-containing protein
MAWHSAIQESEKQVQERTNSYLRYAVDALFEVSSDGYIIFSTPAAEYQWGYPKNDLLGKPITDLVMPEEVDELCALLDEIRKERGRIKVVEHMMRMGDGSWQPCEIIAVGIRDNLFPDSVTLTCRNISERRSYQEQLNFQAYHDPLTKLPNRVFFTELLQNAIERASRSKENVGVIMLDLDNFKFINDTIDHVSGDLLLMHVGNRLQACARPGDTVARWAGDEFIMLLSDVDEETIVAISERIVSVLKAAAYVGGRDVYMTASMGAALSAQGMREADDLLRDVDSAMHQAKARGKDQIVFFDTAMNMIMVKRWELENDLRKALDNKEFRLFYQPIVSLDTGVMVEVEALIRWMHPEKGMICPSDFIPLAEENGLICSIGRWVLYEACRQGNEWRRSIPRIPPLVISVNLSARQLQEPKLLEEINMAVEQSGFSPDLLKIEITESATMEEGQETITKLDSIRQLGIRLAVDDFGTGYSSMSYLSSLPIDTLKIDRSFIAKMMSSMDDGAIVEAIVSLGKMLHMSITCEGIETREEAIKLRALGSDRGQGYYFGRPVPAEEITNTLQSGKLFAIDPSESDDFIDSSADRFSI